MVVPMWLAITLASCLLWAVLFVADAHLVAVVFDRPWVGVLTSGAVSALALPLVGIWAAATWQPLGWDTVALGLLTGVAFVACQYAHFQAMAYTEAGIVAAYWGMTPVFTLAGGAAVLGEHLTGWQYAGVGVLVAAAVLFGLADTKGAGRWRALWLMLAGCVFQAGYLVAQKVVYSAATTPQAFAVILAGMAAAGLSPLAFGGCRRVVRGNMPRLRAAGGMLLVIEGVHLGAVFTGQLGVDAGSPSLVAAMEGTTSGLTFLLSLALYALTRRFGEEQAGRRLWLKLILVAVMALGVWMVS